jgi:CBS domain-containing protein
MGKFFVYVLWSESAGRSSVGSTGDLDNRLQEVVDLFQGHVLKGKRLYAILVTDNGLPTGRLLGILTIWDLPKILKKLE